MENTKRNGFVQGAAILGIAGLLVKIIGAVYRIPLANILGEAGLPYYETAYPFYSWLLVISSAGLPTAISKLVSERIALGNVVGAKNVFRTAMKLLIMIGLVTSLLLFFLSSGIATLSNREPAKFSLMALSPSLLFVSVMCAYRGYLQGMQRMTGTALSQIIEQVIKLAAGFGLAYLFKKLYPDRPELAAMGALIGVSISELVALIVIRFYYGVNMRRGALPVCVQTNRAGAAESTRAIIRRLLIIAVPITVGASIMPIAGIADAVLIVNILEAKGVAAGLAADVAKATAEAAFVSLRSYVTPLINMPAVLTLSLSMSLVPAISDSAAKRQNRVVNSASRTGIKLAMFIGVPCAVGLFVVGGPIMGLLYSAVRNSQERFLQAQQIMYIAAIGVLFLSLVQTLTGIIQGLGKARVPVYFLAAGSIVKIVSMVLLMKFTNLGILGAAISTVLCYAVAGIGDTYYVIRKTGMSISYADTFFKPIIASVVMGVVVYFAYWLGAQLGHPTIATLFSIAAGVIVYIAAMVLMRPFSASDLEFLPKKQLFARLFRIN